MKSFAIRIDGVNLCAISMALQLFLQPVGIFKFSEIQNFPSFDFPDFTKDGKVKQSDQGKVKPCGG